MAAPSPNAPQTPTRSGGLIPPEWSARAADTVIDTVATVRDKTTRPAQLAARGVVYGLVLAVAGTAAGILALVVVVRMYSNWMPGDVWVLYAVLAVAFLVGGFVCLARANRPTPTT